MSRKSIKDDSNRINAMTDEEVDYANILEVDESFIERVPLAFPPPKKQLTIRLDEDVYVWLKGQGRGYQTRINAILRAYYDAHKHGTVVRP